MIDKSEIDKITTQKSITALKTEIIYQYSSYETSLNKIILNKTIRFSNPKLFNDPFDCNENLLKFNFNNESIKMHIEELSEKKISRSKRRGMIKKLKDPRTLNEMFKKRKDEYKISCFSKLYDEVLIWSHYADKHNGICTGFNFPHEYKDKFILSPVNYYNKLEKLDGETDYRKVLLYWMTTKSERWKYEQEIRAISKSNTLENYEDISYDKKYIREIIFGCNVSKNSIDIAIERVKQSDIPFDGIVFKKMVIDSKTFLLKEKVLIL